MNVHGLNGELVKPLATSFYFHGNMVNIYIFIIPFSRTITFHVFCNKEDIFVINIFELCKSRQLYNVISLSEGSNKDNRLLPKKTITTTFSLTFTLAMLA